MFEEKTRKPYAGRRSVDQESAYALRMRFVEIASRKVDTEKGERLKRKAITIVSLSFLSPYNFSLTLSET